MIWHSELYAEVKLLRIYSNILLWIFSKLHIAVAMARSTKENSSDRFNSHNDNIGTPFLVNCLH